MLGLGAPAARCRDPALWELLPGAAPLPSQVAPQGPARTPCARFCPESN